MKPRIEFTTYPRIRTTYLGKLVTLSQRRFYLAHNIDITREQERILRELRMEDALDQSTLAKRAQQNKYNASKTLQILEQRGLIVRHPKPNNKRQYSIYITLAGEELHKSAFPVLEKWRDIFFKGYSVEEIYELLRLVDKCIVNMEEYLGIYSEEDCAYK